MPATWDGLTLFNAGEALWWFFAAGVVVAKGRAVRGATPGLRTTLALFLLAFKITDLVEMRTGAWWDPPALLAAKGLCVAGIVGCLLRWRGLRRRTESIRAEGRMPSERGGHGGTAIEGDVGRKGSEERAEPA
jgi:hypothetical protein